MCQAKEYVIAENIDLTKLKVGDTIDGFGNVTSLTAGTGKLKGVTTIACTGGRKSVDLQVSIAYKKDNSGVIKVSLSYYGTTKSHGDIVIPGKIGNGEVLSVEMRNNPNNWIRTIDARVGGLNVTFPESINCQYLLLEKTDKPVFGDKFNAYPKDNHLKYVVIPKKGTGGPLESALSKGGLDVEELLSEAVCREVAEEMGLQVKVKDLAFVIEGLHGERFHRVDLVFLCEYIGKIENAVLQGDTNQVGFDWLDIKNLNTTPLYPSKLRRQIMNLYEGKVYKKYLGDEEIGDPEVIN